MWNIQLMHDLSYVSHFINLVVGCQRDIFETKVKPKDLIVEIENLGTKFDISPVKI